MYDSAHLSLLKSRGEKQNTQYTISSAHHWILTSDRRVTGQTPRTTEQFI